MVKKILILVMAFVLNFGIMNAQVEPAHFFDNTSLVVKGGIVTPLNDMGTVSYEKVGVEIEKGITPWFGVALDGNFYIGNDEWNTHTAFDRVNVNALAKFNVFNLFGTFKGERRTFELVPFTGIGWGHNTCSDFGLRNYMTYKAGLDIEFNLGESKAWGLRLQPAVTWGCPEAGKLAKYNGEFELNVGVVYHFKNKDGRRTFTMVRRYDQNEVDNLNAQINDLREKNNLLVRENEALNTRLAETPTNTATVTEVRVDTIMIMPRTQFIVNSAKLLPEVEGNVVEMAEYMKAHPEKTFTIIGYASVEGNENYNMTLSEMRANTLRDKLIGYGVNGDQVLAKGAGATDRFSTKRTMNRVVIVEENR